MDRAALADFLTRRREGLTPADVGLHPGARRRVPGLKRDEVAQLAAMSTDYYARLEQQRGPQPSTQMLASLARALRLTGDERDYLFRVAGHSAPDRSAPGGHVAPALLRVLDRLTDTPAVILSRADEVLAQNALAKALLGDAEAFTGMERSGSYRWFTDPDRERRHYPPADHDRQSRAQVSALRAAFAELGPRSRVGEVVEQLLARSPEFARLWEQHEVRRRFEDQKVLLHPEVGDIELRCQALFTEDGSQALLVLTAAPGSEAEGKLRLLAVLGTQRLSGAH